MLRHFPGEQVAELGGELIDSGHTHIRDLAAELGLILEDYSLDAGELSRALFFFGGQPRSEREVVEAFIPIALAIERDLRALGARTLHPSDPDVVALDRLSLAEWLDTRGARGWIRTLLEVAYTTEMGLPPDQQSALNLLTFIEPSPDPFKVYGESDERFHLQGGNERLVRALAEPLADAIELGSVLESVRRSPAGRLIVTVRRGASSRELQASQVVLALPLTLLRRVELAVELPELSRRAIAESAYGSNAKLMIGFERRIWRESARSDGSTFADLSYQSTWDSSRLQPGASGILTNFVGGAQGHAVGRGSAAEQAAAAVRDLELVFPGISARRNGMTEARFHWPTHAWTLGSYVCPRPGDWTRFAGAFAKPFAGLHFAGEHCSANAQGFMEGACESGELVAARIVSELGVAPLRYPSDTGVTLRAAGSSSRPRLPAVSR